MSRIVLISDDDALRQDLRTLVSERGHSMIERPAPRFYEARRERLDVAFIDLSPSGNRGLALVALTRIHLPGARIAVIDGGRGTHSLNRLARAISFGADEFMKKPVLVDDAVGVFERLGL
jgi:ActR/RegA family two-component response regulator